MNSNMNELFYFDIHGHKEKLLPPILRLIEPGRVPKDIKLGRLSGTGVNGFIVCAIGDPGTFRKRKADPFSAVLRQIDDIKKTIAAGGGRIALTGKELKDAASGGQPVFVLGIEGGDFVGEDLSRLAAVYQQGVRVFQPMHYSKNQLGSISFGWGGKVVPAEEQTGLTALGGEVIKEAVRLGMVVDLAHADESTVLSAAKLAEAPLLCSHTGPRALQDFPRYLSDEALKAIADTGGLIGLWAFLHKGNGVENLSDFSRYAKYIADLVGVEHLAVGTDINGVPGNMRGYENLNDAHVIIETFEDGGFSADEIKLIAGGNFLCVFKQVAG